jgi:membrane-associated phospholipid phosphatase
MLTCNPLRPELVGLDEAARKLASEPHGPTATVVKVTGRYSIKRHVLIPTFAVLWMVGNDHGMPRVHRAGRAGVVGIVATALASEGIKRFLCRGRPVDCGDASNWGEAGNRSFPSGHAGTAFAAATAVAYAADEPAIAGAAFTAAAVLSTGRIIADRHWLSDVIAGAALGTAVTVLVSLALASPALASPVSRSAARRLPRSAAGLLPPAARSFR